MLQTIARRFQKTPLAAAVSAEVAITQEKARLNRADPLDPLAALGRARLTFDGGSQQNPIRVTVKDYPHEDLVPDDVDTDDMPMAVLQAAKIGDNKLESVWIGDDWSGGSSLAGFGPGSPQIANPAVLSWFASQSFIGWQSCAIIAQHWLVDKACTMSGEDACRNGWVLKTKTGDDLTAEQNGLLKALDVEYHIMENLSEFNRFKNIFGIRVAIFEVDSDDPKYYEKPFNIDGVTEGSYKGISQVDPYWMMPMLTTESTADPSSRFFYDPEYWIISGKKYHRSHLIIARGPQPADILKPTYVFGGIPLTQRIYERVYAAERTANEAPLLSLSKRTTAIHVDLESLAMNQQAFEERLAKWISYRDNYAVKVLGTQETMEQFDTSMSDFDAIIMNQFQLVAAIAETPATELLGTSPKGFNATGEFEMKSYSKKQVSIQKHTFTPLLDRHYLLLSRSRGINVELTIIWNSTDTPTEKELAALNDLKAQTAERYINMGSVAPDEVRDNLKEDDHSGFNHLTDDPAHTDPGMSPENLAKFQEAGAEEQRGEAQTVAAGARATAAGTTPGAAAQTAENKAPTEPTDKPQDDEGSRGNVPPAPSRTPGQSLSGITREPGINAPQAGELARAAATIMSSPTIAPLLRGLAKLLEQVDDTLVPEGQEPGAVDNGRARTVKGSVSRSVDPTVRSVHDVIPSPADIHKLPKMKYQGLMLGIENPRGTVRRGMSLTGDAWEAKMHHHYGFIKNVMGADGDELDCFVGHNMTSDRVYVINQNEPSTGQFDEHKVMLGFDDAAGAKAGYIDSFNDGWTGFDSMWEMSLQDFRNWIGAGDCASPLNEACIGATNSFPMDK